MAKLKAPETAGFNAGKNYYSKPFRVEDIVIDPVISKVFTIQEKAIEEIARRIRENGYDKSQPVVVWKGKNILLDGHTRLEAAKKLGLEEVPATELEFESMEDALLYTFERQAIRRNLTPAEILSAAQILDRRKARDGRGRAAEQVAESLGVSPAQMYRAKRLLKEAAGEDLEAVRKGERSIRSVYNQVTGKEREEKNVSPVQAEMFKPVEITALSGELGEIVKKINGIIGYIDGAAADDPPLREIRPSLLIRLREVRMALEGIQAKRSIS